jgi:adenine-specific DNA-methyltransferase
MMTEIVRARCALTPYFNDFHERTPYLFKRHAIQSCPGADIDAGAIEIAKLRLWLSLVVDEEEVRRIKPLPNLDYKLVAGNSLLGFPFKTEGLQEVEKLIDRHVDEPDREEKAKLKHEIDSKLNKCLAASESTLGYKVDFDFHVHFSEVFRRRGGFDVTIGNPPYVRADEQSEDHKRLRERILASRQYETLWEKWDLFVPFIEKAYKLLRPGGVTTMIVSDAFCHSKYAQKPQKWLLENASVKRLDFCSDLQIFEAVVHNMIYFFQKADGAHNRPDRRLHHETFGNVTMLPSDEQANLTYRAFFPQAEEHPGFLCSTLPIGRICYLSYGLAVSSDEKEHKGEFVTEDVTLDFRDNTHPKPWVEGKLLAKWLPLGNRWLEWGTARAPSRFRRLTFEELFEVPEKILIMRVAGSHLRSCYDSQHLYTNHTSIIAVPWYSLAGVRNRSVKKAARYLDENPARPDQPNREELEAISGRFSVKYLLGVINSASAREFLRANRRSNTDLYPEDWKKLPIPDVPPEKQTPVANLVDQILAAKRRDADADVSALEREIDDVVCELYGLGKEEITIVEGATSNRTPAAHPTA